MLNKLGARKLKTIQQTKKLSSYKLRLVRKLWCQWLENRFFKLESFPTLFCSKEILCRALTLDKQVSKSQSTSTTNRSGAVLDDLGPDAAEQPPLCQSHAAPRDSSVHPSMPQNTTWKARIWLMALLPRQNPAAA